MTKTQVSPSRSIRALSFALAYVIAVPSIAWIAMLLTGAFGSDPESFLYWFLWCTVGFVVGQAATFAWRRARRLVARRG